MSDDYPSFPFDPGGTGTPREWLILALKTAMTDGQARIVVDALDAYLAEDPAHRAVFTFDNLRPNYRDEIEKLRGERDAAIACAEQALRAMQKTLDGLKSTGGDR